MSVFSDIDLLTAKIPASVVTVGNFDGVHLGHRSILRALHEESRARKIPSVAVTFDPHPAAVLSGRPPPLLTIPSRRAELLEALDVDHVLILPFTAAVATLSAGDFLRDLLQTKLKMKALVIGPTTHIGRGREGTPERIRTLAKSGGFDLHIAPAVEVDGAVVSSSRIRGALEEGDVSLAERLLGRFYRSEGKIVPGDGRGKGLGFPTANLGPTGTLLPARGVYATRVWIDDLAHAGATNVGVRPTVDATGRFVVETHVLGWRGELNGRSVVLEWLQRIREEKKFASLEELRAQISQDVGTTEKIVASCRNVS